MAPTTNAMEPRVPCEYSAGPPRCFTNDQIIAAATTAKITVMAASVKWMSSSTRKPSTDTSCGSP